MTDITREAVDQLTQWLRDELSERIVPRKLAARTLEALRNALDEAERERDRLAGCLRIANSQAERFEREHYLTSDRADAAVDLLHQAIAAMSKLRQSLEFPGKHGGLYVFPEEAVRKFTDDQAALMYEEKRIAALAKEAGSARTD